MNKIIKALSLGLALSLPALANASIVTVNGADVSFTYDDGTLFGSANVIGNTIFFLPTTFSAESLNGAGAVTANQTLNITVQSTTGGFVIENLVLQESGDYLLRGAGASASVNGQLSVTSQTTLDGLFPFRAEQIFSAGPLAVADDALHAWNAGAGIDLTGVAGWGSDTKVTATIENLLEATTLNDLERAFVEKKFEGIALTINPVPLPAALWLFGAGLAGLLAVARRNTRH
jgi:hypothetical protein